MSLQDLIPVVNKLQDIVTTTQLADLDLPILAVVGSQSCGKSSVIENIVGKDFLPRGTGIVTRRPLVLQLIHVNPTDPIVKEQSESMSNGTSIGGHGFNDDHLSSSNVETSEIDLEEHLRRHAATTSTTNNGTASTSTGNPVSSFAPLLEWGEFLHIPNKRFYNFNQIRREIESETARIAGQNKGISRLPINLKIYSPNVLNLTLVDLPGITKVPVGDQPGDIERQTRNLILEYISKPNCIILAVSPANVDLVNSESLKLARQVDPTGKRTVGILTKLDLMDQGTNALDILKGNIYPLKLGFIGIVNRSQQDISENKALEDSLYAEHQFFLNHPAYRSISNKCGTKYLAQTLNRILMNHIRERLPDIKAKLNTLMGQTEQELASYGDFSLLDTSKESRGALVLNLMTKFATSFINSIEGTSVNEVSTKELCGGARLYFIYYEVFGSQLAAINPTHNLSISDIRTAIRNSTGPRPSLFVPELAFDLLVKPQIKLLEDPSKRCVEQVYEELMKIVHNICSTGVGIELNRYPKLQSKLIEVVSDLLRERLGPTIKYVESLIDIHRAYINTNHPNFVGAAKAMSMVVDERRKLKEQELQRKMKLTSERILLKNSTKVPDSPDLQPKESGDEVTSDDQAIYDINQVDDYVKPVKQLRNGSHSIRSSDVNSTVSNTSYQHESYLNYFFGKDPISQQQHLAAQAQLNPTPFKYPNSVEAPLQFNSNFTHQNGAVQMNGSVQVSLENGQAHEHEHMAEEMARVSMEESMEYDRSFNDLSEREQMECELIRRLIVSYFSIVREMVQDQVPKLIMCLLVNFIKENIQNRLVVKLYSEQLFDELLQEDATIQIEREKCIDLLKTYREASRVISDVV
ncbi:Dynamin- GTPase protein [Scheffersomyces spartinae]|uniref:dynamin GTPase n=1 Tax=Scheffersomyces spartinae TaxID=45513 RepID=A0A9P8AHR4_9ASCO|nr:Dynamin- GTPase protein [Scheffersomyces spartinae]KAG7193047.1 Dynamin- GTPase protein [Scheffersomyces spartinae]